MPAASVAIQGRLDDLGTPLLDVEFVVLDLETTGGSPANDRITEVGAVKIRGGEVLGTFHTLVNPEVPIPPLISALTGITNPMVAAAERSRGGFGVATTGDESALAPWLFVALTTYR